MIGIDSDNQIMPDRKNDLVRFKDNYGRQSKPYEGKNFTKKIGSDFVKFKKPKLSRNQLFTINEQDTIQIEIISHQDTATDIYIGQEMTVGDVNEDLEINVLDVILVINFILHTNDPTLSQLWASDLNQDNNINIQDIILLVNMILN